MAAEEVTEEAVTVAAGMAAGTVEAMEAEVGLGRVVGEEQVGVVDWVAVGWAGPAAGSVVVEAGVGATAVVTVGATEASC